MADSSVPNPSSSMLWFLIMTVIYSYADYKYGADATASKGIFAGYIGFVVICQYFLNRIISASICGSVQEYTAMIVTLVPWGFIFGLLALMLSMFPGWLGPFSNTFGYGFALMAGLNGIMANILEPNPKGKDSMSAEATAVSQALAHIYSDQGMLINEITTDNFEYFWKNMKGVMQPSALANDTWKNQLYAMVRLKNVVATFVWYMLAGLLITSVSFNFMVNTPCAVSAAIMQSKHEEYEQELIAAQEKAKTDNANSKVYSTTE